SRAKSGLLALRDDGPSEALHRGDDLAPGVAMEPDREPGDADLAQRRDPLNRLAGLDRLRRRRVERVADVERRRAADGARVLAGERQARGEVVDRLERRGARVLRHRRRIREGHPAVAELDGAPDRRAAVASHPDRGMWLLDRAKPHAVAGRVESPAFE